MCYKITILSFLFHFCLFGQEIKKPNEDFNISDSLIYKRELRIYKEGSITNYKSLFQIYQDNDLKWHANYYKITNNDFKKINLTIQTDFDLLWLNIINTNIEFISDWENIEYKLYHKKGVKINKGEYINTFEKTLISDGHSVEIKFRNNEKRNEINYPNPKMYFELFPKVDELAYVIELINLLENTFPELK